jgi:hypothetical protein
MPTPRDHLEALSRDLDMVVFRLERPPPADQPAEAWVSERRRLRRELERLRDRVEDVARGL